jgi:hypothetical protein
LSDLYVRGKEMAFTDGRGESVTVWLAKPSSIDSESIRRRAQAAKARYQIGADDEESDEYLASYSVVRDHTDHDRAVDILIGEDLLRSRERIEAQYATDEATWGKDGYLQGLHDSWVGTDEEPGLAKTLQEDPEDPDVVRVKAELERFEAEVLKAVEQEEQRLRRDWDGVDLHIVWRKTAHVLVKRRADELFVREFRRQQLFYSVRQLDDHTKRYFGTLAELDELDETIVGQLTAAINVLLVDATEGKDSPATPDSSSSSEPPPETSQPSGLEVAAV